MYTHRHAQHLKTHLCAHTVLCMSIQPHLCNLCNVCKSSVALNRLHPVAQCLLCNCMLICLQLAMQHLHLCSHHVLYGNALASAATHSRYLTEPCQKILSRVDPPCRARHTSPVARPGVSICTQPARQYVLVLCQLSWQGSNFKCRVQRPRQLLAKEPPRNMKLARPETAITVNDGCAPELSNCWRAG